MKQFRLFLYSVVAAAAIAGGAWYWRVSNLSFEEALNAYNREGNYLTAYLAFRKMAHDGDPEAQMMLSDMYKIGVWVERDRWASIHWAMRAAERGYPRGLANAGDNFSFHAMSLGFGDGDNRVAFGWYMMAAEAGDLTGYARVGEAYLHGDGVEKDIELGRQWLQRAVAGEGEVAKFSMAEALRDGVFGEPDFLEALRLFLDTDLENSPWSLHAAVLLLGDENLPTYDREEAYSLSLLGHAWFHIRKPTPWQAEAIRVRSMRFNIQARFLALGWVRDPYYAPNEGAKTRAFYERLDRLFENPSADPGLLPGLVEEDFQMDLDTVRRVERNVLQQLGPSRTSRPNDRVATP